MNNFKILVLSALAATMSLASCKKDETTVTPTVVAPVTPNEYMGVLLNNPDKDSTNADNKFLFSSLDGTTKTYLNGKVAPANIDFAYFFGNTAKATITSPDDYLTTIFGGLKLYTTKNATRFRTANTTYANVTRNTQIDTIWSSASVIPVGANNSGSTQEGSRAANLSAGNQLAVKFASGKYGILEIVSVPTDAATTGKLTFKIKIQK